MELSTEEWQDFVKELYNGIGKWEKRYGSAVWRSSDIRTSPRNSSVSREPRQKRWTLYIYYSDKSEPDKFMGIDAYPPNWHVFKKTMDDMEEKIKEKAR